MKKTFMISFNNENNSRQAELAVKPVISSNSIRMAIAIGGILQEKEKTNRCVAGNTRL